MHRRWMAVAVLAVVGAIAGARAADYVPDASFKVKGDATKGAEIYKTYCALCHGPTGAGDGVGAAALNPKPRALNDKSVMAEISDHQIFTAIKSGGIAVGKSPLMVAWGAVLGDDQKIHDVAAYVRSLAP